jgi:hypothetical protein
MGKLKEALKGRRQSKNIDDRTKEKKDKITEIILESDKESPKELQAMTGEFSVHLRDKTPLKKQKPDMFTKFMNELNNEPKEVKRRAKLLRSIKDTSKPTRLTDVVFPKEKK